MALVLGSVAFSDWEAPSQISFGGKHQIVRHRTLGGPTVTDAMGPQDTDIQWEGTFFGQFAALRARRLDLFRRSGRKLTLTWSSFIYEVIVIGFRGDYKRENHVPYHIECAVTRDFTSDFAQWAVDTAESWLDEQLSEALGATGGDPYLGAVVDGLRTTITNAVTGGDYTLRGLGNAALAGVQVAAAGAFVAATGAAADADAALAPDKPLPETSDPARIAEQVQQTSNAAEGASRARQVSQRIGAARARIPGPPPPPPFYDPGALGGRGAMLPPVP